MKRKDAVEKYASKLNFSIAAGEATADAELLSDSINTMSTKPLTFV